MADNNDKNEKKNMHYLFNRYYIETIVNGVDNMKVFNQSVIKQFNSHQGEFCENNNLFIKKLPEKITIMKYNVMYPGILVGLGYPHEVNIFKEDEIKYKNKIKGQISCGLSIDYVTGCPYIPGSSIKGIIKHASEKCHERYHVDNIDDDIFYGAYVIGKTKNSKNYSLIGMENITPHSSNTKNPVPISMLKIMPETVLAVVISIKENSEERKDKYNKILTELGVGAKTNVGFGVIESINDDDIDRNVKNYSTNAQIQICKVKGCNERVTFNKKNNRYYKYCYNHRGYGRNDNAVNNKS